MLRRLPIFESRLRRILGPLAFAVVPVVAAGCLDRPVVSVEASTFRHFVQRLRVTKIDKVDLLIVVDNSSSMKDKQSELGRRIPELIEGLTKPSTDPITGRVSQVFDVHVGVISSSLGSYGTGACHTGWFGPHVNDHAYLLPRAGDPKETSGFQVDASGNPVPAACPDVASGKPLSWVADAKRDPSAKFMGTDGAAQLQAAASCVVQSVQDDGCGYEATWESIYRFLADPAPYVSAEVSCSLPAKPDAYSCSGSIKASGKDDTLLGQRKQFLREDSLLAVIVLSDENDFSVRPEGRNWKPFGVPMRGMPHAWPGCANVPDDLEPDDFNGFADLKTKWNCRSCDDDPSDPVCATKWPDTGDVDHPNLRGFHQIQRFGWNTLWSRNRYIDAFQRPQVFGSDGKLGFNGVFAGGKRTSDMIVVAGIVGVPKPLVSNGDTPKVLTDADWEKMVSPDLAKRDAHMIESLEARTKYGLKLYEGDRSIDPINGGERTIANGSDLQYACIAPRSTEGGGDDCGVDAEGNPLCNGPGVQPYFKAFPGLRHLRILKGLGGSGFVSSICAESYRPAIRGITDRIRAAVDAQCVRSDVTPDATGNVNCFVVESFATAEWDGRTRCEDIGRGYCTPGAWPCRLEGSDYPPVAPEIAATQLTLPISVMGSDGMSKPMSTKASVDNGNVYAVAEDGKKHLLCEMMQLAGGRVSAEETNACLTDPKFTTPASGGGWCYTSDPAVVGEHCLANGSPGKMRFLGDVEPKNGSEVFTVCIGR